MRTLHLYFARELAKTFFMTSLALTLLVVMGGGVANIFKGEGIGPEEVAKVFAFLTPVAITLILPVAALFSATICYGRAAADNEVTACRAAGINIHRLLLAAGVLGLAVTFFTYWSWNFLIPRLCQEIEDTTRKELHAIVVEQFQKAKPLTFGKYRITANQCRALTEKDLPPDIPPNQTFLMLRGVSFLELDEQEVMRFGTADLTIIRFNREERTPVVTADLQGVRSYDAQRNQSYELQRQILGPYPVPVPIRRKIKFENLPTLLAFRKAPETIPDLEGRFAGLRRSVMEWLLFEDVLDQLDPQRHGTGKYTLADDKCRYEITADRLKVDPENGKPTLGGVRVSEISLPKGPQRVYNADETTFELRSGIKPDSLVVMPQLRGNVTSRRVPFTEGEREVKKASLTLTPLDFLSQPTLKTRYGGVSLSAILTSTASLRMPPQQSRQLEKLKERAQQLLAEVTSEIHFRASYALSVVGMVLLGAVLGIIVRGGQVLTAFGISCVPVLIVVVACIIGRNLADRTQFALASIGVMWAATIFMYLATAVAAVKILRR